MKTSFQNEKQLVGFIQNSTGEKFDKPSAEKFAAYCQGLKSENWFGKYTVERLDSLFRQVKAEGLDFDGKHVTLTPRGVSYDYVAYKNKMLIAYPESKIDLQLVYKEDVFVVGKDSGRVEYDHKIGDPFGHTDEKIVGGYCVVKNNRGEFLTLMSREEIDKHKAVAKTKNIWNNWFPEMCLKTIMRKSTKFHFDDVFEAMNEADNEDYDLDKAGKTELEQLQEEIKELLESYEGEDRNEIRETCKLKYQAGEFDETFAQSIVEHLKGGSNG